MSTSSSSSSTSFSQIVGTCGICFEDRDLHHFEECCCVNPNICSDCINTIYAGSFLEQDEDTTYSCPFCRTDFTHYLPIPGQEMVFYQSEDSSLSTPIRSSVVIQQQSPTDLIVPPSRRDVIPYPPSLPVTPTDSSVSIQNISPVRRSDPKRKRVEMSNEKKARRKLVF